MSIHSGGNQGGTFNFAADTTGNAGCPNSRCPGDPMASFYLGAVGKCQRGIHQRAGQVSTADWVGVSRRRFVAPYAQAELVVQPALGLHHPVRGQEEQLIVYRSQRGQIRMRSPLRELSFPDGLHSQGQSLELPVTALVIPRFRSRRAWAPRVGFAYSRQRKNCGSCRIWDLFRAGFLSWLGGRFGAGWIQQESHPERSLCRKFQNAGYLPGDRHFPQPGRSNPKYLRGFDNGQTPSLYRPLGWQPETLLFAVESHRRAAATQQHGADSCLRWHQGDPPAVGAGPHQRVEPAESNHHRHRF